MPKIKTSFTLDDKTILLLKKVAEVNKRSMASMLSILIEEAAKKEKIKTP